MWVSASVDAGYGLSPVACVVLMQRLAFGFRVWVECLGFRVRI